MTDAAAEPVPTRNRALITGSSRGIGADTAVLLAERGFDVVVNYRDEKKVRRADQVVEKVRAAGGESFAVRADLTDGESVEELFRAVVREWGGLDLLVLNASGGMEAGAAEDYALRLNRDAQVRVLEAAVPLMDPGSRVVFVTSHQAHFIRTTPTMPEYEAVARSKRAGEDALRALIPALEDKGIGFVVVSGDMIEGTVTAQLLNRANPDALNSRREAAGRLYNVNEFAQEIAAAAVEPIPENRTRFVGDLSSFAPIPGE
ncbi:SDR family oxidoreductase [Amnibacterium kyonggiense]|uniref:NAD(P)-dependent dehydrogenase (Short-subunit alcohol dehydrogenase family) n=1 Tax=Amnibacterium kyonggiense TaxID=595671 RepID=A0A4R7FL19_9MICO|nr:SDR family oxidoreductase [Amnibacterium kyonggiense]TDS77065.1 NAD(P)-dependent dehydrogenase (short-subunit alcohol dehydrogenase family) [Amnibacterium kyonggiense]